MKNQDQPLFECLSIGRTGRRWKRLSYQSERGWDRHWGEDEGFGVIIKVLQRKKRNRTELRGTA